METTTEYIAKEFVLKYLQLVNNIEEIKRDIEVIKNDYKLQYGLDVDKLIKIAEEINNFNIMS